MHGKGYDGWRQPNTVIVTPPFLQGFIPSLCLHLFDMTVLTNMRLVPNIFCAFKEMASICQETGLETADDMVSCKLCHILA